MQLFIFALQLSNIANLTDVDNEMERNGTIHVNVCRD